MHEFHLQLCLLENLQWRRGVTLNPGKKEVDHHLNLDESRQHATKMIFSGLNQPQIFFFYSTYYILHLPFWDSSAQENLLGGLDTLPLWVQTMLGSFELGGDEFSNEVEGVAVLGWSPMIWYNVTISPISSICRSTPFSNEVERPANNPINGSSLVFKRAFIVFIALSLAFGLLVWCWNPYTPL